VKYEREYSSLECLISVPPGQQPKEGWPVLVFLHGNKEAAPEVLGAALTKHGPLRQGSASAATEKFVVVAPQLPAPGGDVWKQYADAVKDIAHSAAGDYHGNPAKTYLTGFSYGGNGVLDIGPRQADIWAALWPVDPTRPPVESSDQPIWVSAGEYSRANEQIFNKVWGVRRKCTPERVYYDAGLPHVPTAIDAYGDNATYDWLSKHSSR
jgi:poly(3-hydroxybutyrate) depolymerase